MNHAPLDRLTGSSDGMMWRQNADHEQKRETGAVMIPWGSEIDGQWADQSFARNGIACFIQHAGSFNCPHLPGRGHAWLMERLVFERRNFISWPSMSTAERCVANYTARYKIVCKQNLDLPAFIAEATSSHGPVPPTRFGSSLAREWTRS